MRVVYSRLYDYNCKRT